MSDELQIYLIKIFIYITDITSDNKLFSKLLMTHRNRSVCSTYLSGKLKIVSSKRIAMFSRKSLGICKPYHDGYQKWKILIASFEC